MKTVNLDAMVERADFRAEQGYSSSNRFKQLKASDLGTQSAMRTMIKKPDFQRETRAWNIPQIINFIKSILERHFIPSVILWQNSSALTFVIDGAHRISAFMAWINDDYGDGEISLAFYNNRISDEQMSFAKETRRQIEKNVGKYSKYQDAIRNKQKYTDDIVKLAMGLETFSFDIQWIEGDVSVAEKSFFNINQKAVPINPTELKILESRNKAIGIASRAITYSGMGYKYWKDFSDEIQAKIEELSVDINDLLFLPKFRKPITTLDVSIGGNNQNNLQVIYELLNYVNGNMTDEEDHSGEKTLTALINLKKILQILNSKDPCSLGLHPIIYFYSKKGNFKPAVFYATILFLMDLNRRNKFNDFTKIRSKFEGFIYKYDYMIDQINRILRASKKSAVSIKDLYLKIMTLLLDSKTESEIVNSIMQEYKGINLAKEDTTVESTDFNTNRKSETFIAFALPTVGKCNICGGAIHTNSTSIDHIIRKREGGTGDVSNAQITHPYCNSGYKN